MDYQNIVINGLLGELPRQVLAHEFEFNGDPYTSAAVIQRRAQSFVRYLESQVRSENTKVYPAVVNYGRNIYFCVDMGAEAVLHHFKDQQEYKYNGVILLNPDNDAHSRIILEILYDVVRERLHDMGYTSRSKFKYYKSDEGQKILISMDDGYDPLLFYNGFKFSIIPFGNRFLLLIDHSYLFKIDLLEYFKSLRQQNFKDNEIISRLRFGRFKGQIRTEPFGYNGIITEILSHQSPGNFKISNNETISNYWKKRYGIELSPEDFIVLVKTSKFEELAYPASQVLIDLKNLNLDEEKSEFILSPDQRFSKIQEFIKHFLEITLKLNNTIISFHENEMTNAAYLKQIGIIKYIDRYRQPSLLFQDESPEFNPKKGLRDFGPYAGPVDLQVIGILSSRYQDQFNIFKQLLKQEYEEFKLGKLIIEEPEYYRGNEDEAKFFQIVSELERKPILTNGDKGNIIFLGILPRDKNKKFQFTLHLEDSSLTSKKIQFLTTEVLEKVAKRSGKGLAKSIIQNIITQLYVKGHPDENKSLWILNEPAGKIGKTLYTGFDVSREYNFEYDRDGSKIVNINTEVGIQSSVCDSYGQLITMKVITSTKGEKLTTQNVKHIILHAWRKSMRIGDINRIVLFKDGRVFDELRTIQLGYEKAREVIKAPLDFTVVEVVKFHALRAFYKGNTGLENIRGGTFFTFSDEEGYIFSSDVQHGTSRPKKVRIAFQQNELGVVHQIKQIMHEFHDLCFLDWATLNQNIVGTPLPLLLVQKLGVFARYAINIPDRFDFIPL